jgi:hypothetical protein
MSKRRPPSGRGQAPQRSRSGDAAQRKVEDKKEPGQFLSFAAIRETVESVAIAFVLAFLFRTFEAEAFVIPTGSMAPTLMGRHKDLVCPKCERPATIRIRPIKGGKRPIEARCDDCSRFIKWVTDTTD